MNTAVAVIGLPEIERMAEYAVQSQLFGVKTVPQAVSLMLLCQAKGLHPMEAMETYHIINGRQSMKAEQMLAKFQEAGGTVKWIELTDERAEATFSHPKGGSVTLHWDLEMAKRAGLAGKDVWKSYGRAMLRSRVVSEGITAVLPGVKGGAMTPEEAADITDPGEPRDVTPSNATGVAALTERLAAIAPPGGGIVDAFELTPRSVEEQILSQLRDTALEGPASLKAAWEGLDKDHRKALGAHLPALKDAAQKAEADEAALRG